jgi:hypothetical protein
MNKHNFNVFLTVHLSIDFISVTNLMHNFLSIHITLQPSTCFEQYYAHPQEVTQHMVSSL